MKKDIRDVFDNVIYTWELNSYEDPKIQEALGYAMREAYNLGYKAGGEDAYDSEFNTWHKLSDTRNLHTTDPVYSRYYTGYADPSDYRFKEQRKLRGFDDSELWDLYRTIAKFVLPRLKRFIECTGAYPSQEYNSLDEYKKDLNEIVWYLENIVLDENETMEELNPESKPRIEHAKDLIRNLLFTLWW